MTTGFSNFNESHIPLAYFISFRCYGTWLHGDERGSVDRAHNQYATPFLSVDEKREAEGWQRLRCAPIIFDDAQRLVVDQAMRDVCIYRHWLLHALNVRTNHVHAVVAAGIKPERAMHDFKAYATRALVKAGHIAQGEPVWSRHGSTKYLWQEINVEGACHYVLHQQGDNLLPTDFFADDDEHR